MKGTLVIDVLENGAIPDGETLCTEAIQNAIDRCSRNDGGIVFFPKGVYLSGTIFLESRVTLHLEAGAVLMGSPNLEDYPPTISSVESRTAAYNQRSLIIADALSEISIIGQGVIDGNGSHFKDKSHDGQRPLILRMENCTNIVVRDVTLQNSGFWNQHYLACEHVQIRNIRVWNHATYNADGIDIDGCRDVFISGCLFDADDDALCLKSTMSLPCRNIVISDCIISSHCNAIKMGTDSTGGFIDVTISNCQIVSPRHSDVLYGLQRGISGISLELVDGGRLERVTISNVTIDGVEVPLFIRLGDRGSGLTIEGQESAKLPVGVLRDVVISNLIASGAGKTGCSIMGIPGHCVENVSLCNVTIRTEGGGQLEWSSAEVPEKLDGYPEATMFGKLPAYGLTCRHVQGLTLDGVTISSDEVDDRYGVVLDDALEVNINNLMLPAGAGKLPAVLLRDSQHVLVRGCQPNVADEAYLDVQGARCKEIALVANNLRRVHKVASFSKGAETSSVQCVGNVE